MAALGPENAHIFRITHRDNLPWILDHGLHCQNSAVQDPNFVPIGMENLIEKRQHRGVEIGPGGTLADYVPFYFTPWSIMMYNIKTGYNGVIKRANEEIVILVSSIFRLAELRIPFVFFDGHAYLAESNGYESVADLDKIDWPLLRSRNFANDPEDPGKKGRYQAEALAYRQVPLEALLGLACYNQEVEDSIRAEIEDRGLNTAVKICRSWYF